MKKALTGILILTLFLLGTQLTKADEVKADYIIKYKAEKDTSEVKNYKKKFKYLGNTVLATLTVQEYESLKSDPYVEYIEKDGLIHSAEANSTLGDYVPQYIIEMHIPEVQKIGLLGTGVKVAVLDTGINDHSQDIQVKAGVSFIPEESTYNDMSGHGTAVASIIASQINNTGLAGIAPSVELYAVKVMNKDRVGSISQLISGIEWAIDNGIDIVNLSLGTDTYSSSLEDAVETAVSNNILLVAATGNAGLEGVMYPARVKEVLAIGAVDASDQLAPFSNTGKEVDFVAPGVNVYTLDLNDEIVPRDGTSFATPHVTALAALIKQKYPHYSNEQISAALRKNAKKLGSPKQYGSGMPDALFLID